MFPPRPLPTWQQALQRSWLRRSWVGWLLWPISLVLTGLVRLRQGLYMSGMWRREQMPVPVVVVGNVVAGGAGKTPVVIALVEHLQARGHHPGVISRGHGRVQRDCRSVQPQSLPQDVGDEPCLVQRRTGVPVFVAPTRIQAAHALLAHHPQTDILVSDDGLQHLSLGRDIEICVFDDRGIGNGWLLPAGPLREPWPRHVDLILHTGGQPAFPGLRSHRALADHAVNAAGQQVSLAALAERSHQGTPIWALAGIAQPQAFFDMLQARGLALAGTLAFPDHAPLDDFALPDAAQGLLLCTEKDAVKLWQHRPDALAVPLKFTPQPEFFQQFDQLLDEVRRARLSSEHGHSTP